MKTSSSWWRQRYGAKKKQKARVKNKPRTEGEKKKLLGQLKELKVLWKERQARKKAQHEFFRSKLRGVFLEMPPAQLLKHIETYFGELRSINERIRKTSPKELYKLEKLNDGKKAIEERIDAAMNAWQKDKAGIMMILKIGVKEKKSIMAEAGNKATEIGKTKNTKEKIGQISRLIKEINRNRRESVSIIDSDPEKARNNLVAYLTYEHALTILEKNKRLKEVINYLTIAYT
ncbi:MAG: hypothetical protein ABIE23_06340 [archaeon]|nr:hypothetical protein [Candidatus Micrarchaeota archaeon]